MACGWHLCGAGLALCTITASGLQEDQSSRPTCLNHFKPISPLSLNWILPAVYKSLVVLCSPFIPRPFRVVGLVGASHLVVDVGFSLKNAGPEPTKWYCPGNSV